MPVTLDDDCSPTTITIPMFLNLFQKGYDFQYLQPDEDLSLRITFDVVTISYNKNLTADLIHYLKQSGFLTKRKKYLGSKSYRL